MPFQAHPKWFLQISSPIPPSIPVIALSLFAAEKAESQVNQFAKGHTLSGRTRILIHTQWASVVFVFHAVWPQHGSLDVRCTGLGVKFPHFEELGDQVWLLGPEFPGREGSRSHTEPCAMFLWAHVVFCVCLCCGGNRFKFRAIKMRLRWKRVMASQRRQIKVMGGGE